MYRWRTRGTSVAIDKGPGPAIVFESRTSPPAPSAVVATVVAAMSRGVTARRSYTRVGRRSATTIAKDPRPASRHIAILTRDMNFVPTVFGFGHLILP